jgi:hypothetical protein
MPNCGGLVSDREDQNERTAPPEEGLGWIWILRGAHVPPSLASLARALPFTDKKTAHADHHITLEQHNNNNTTTAAIYLLVITQNPRLEKVLCGPVSIKREGGGL